MKKVFQFQKELIKGMKILLYNPNTSEAITEKLYETAKLVVSSETTLIPKTAKKGHY